MRARSAEARRHEKYQRLPVERVFAEIYQNKEWGGNDEVFYSGTGSHDPAIVTPYVEAIQKLLTSFVEKPVLVDIGSGDFNVGKNFVEYAKYYYACDIVPELQEFNQQNFNFSNVKFLKLNAVQDMLPDGDILFVRQVFQHLSNAHIAEVLEKCQKFPRLIITEHLPLDENFKANVDIAAGCGIRMLFNSGVVLTEPPFSLSGYSTTVLCEVPEYGGLIRTVLFERSSIVTGALR
jgi:hypothetical protein